MAFDGTMGQLNGDAFGGSHGLLCGPHVELFFHEFRRPSGQNSQGISAEVRARTVRFEDPRFYGLIVKKSPARNVTYIGPQEHCPPPRHC